MTQVAAGAEVERLPAHAALEGDGGVAERAVGDDHGRIADLDQDDQLARAEPGVDLVGRLEGRGSSGGMPAGRRG